MTYESRSDFLLPLPPRRTFLPLQLWARTIRGPLIVRAETSSTTHYGPHLPTLSRTQGNLKLDYHHRTACGVPIAT